ncbi:MAG: nucleotidyl transferase AbiEii/AbiGii toxin family protein [Deltaproteobacteria bacterium]|nr:nucleotidyl transferase AbiEii/AbiGii toxin family protein [Deltaproteobacteria bacterium]
MQTQNYSPIIVHEDGDFFREALLYTANMTGLNSQLVEKDYFCSVLLSFLYSDESSLVFKGGTCLSKVYGGFYRLSEDLDFMISTPSGSSRSLRRKTIEPLKKRIGRISDVLPVFTILENLTGRNNSTQYMAQVQYRSSIREVPATIKIEIGLREELLTLPQKGRVKTLLNDPFSRKPAVQEFTVSCMSPEEAYAEKLRAALTRTELAIRDFYDIDYAVQEMGLDLSKKDFLDLVIRKLTVPGNDPVNITSARKEVLRRQLETELKPILREKDFQRFDLDRAFNLVTQIGSRLQRLN